MTDPGPRLPSAVPSVFHECLAAGGVVARAPGRINLIGEHTDYNDGLALPAAIDRATWVAAQPRSDPTLAIQSFALQQTVEVDLAGPLVAVRDWRDYVVGVAWALQQAGVSLRGASLAIYSELPLGAGVASSAALEVGVALALAHVAEVSLTPLAVARLCQFAENAFVGARCGLLDQMAVTHGRNGHALLLDCRSLELTPVRFPDSLRVVLCDSMVRHTHSTGGFNRRREECDAAVARLRERIPDLRSLRDLSASTFATLAGYLPEPLDRRVQHVVAENDRVVEMAAALTALDRPAMRRCMAASHASLRDLYEVSIPQLDRLIETAALQPGVVGSRMMGGGFGGCTITLVEAEHVEGFAVRVRDIHASATGTVPNVFVCEPGPAADTLVGRA